MTTATPRLALGFVATAIAFALVLAGTATARPQIGSDGKVHACYRVKGKPKGAIRVVGSSRSRCWRGERKVAWVASVVPGAGDTGVSGEPGRTGAQGPPGSVATNSVLEEKVNVLTTRVEALEGILQGVTNKALTETIATVAGLTNAQLLEAVNSVPTVEALCAQVTDLTDQTGLLGDAIEGLSLNGVLTALGGLLNIPALPAALPPFSCA